MLVLMTVLVAAVAALTHSHPLHRHQPPPYYHSSTEDSSQHGYHPYHQAHRSLPRHDSPSTFFNEPVGRHHPQRASSSEGDTLPDNAPYNDNTLYNDNAPYNDNALYKDGPSPFADVVEYPYVDTDPYPPSHQPHYDSSYDELSDLDQSDVNRLLERVRYPFEGYSPVDSGTLEHKEHYDDSKSQFRGNPVRHDRSSSQDQSLQGLLPRSHNNAGTLGDKKEGSEESQNSGFYYLDQKTSAAGPDLGEWSPGIEHPVHDPLATRVSLHKLYDLLHNLRELYRNDQGSEIPGGFTQDGANNFQHDPSKGRDENLIRRHHMHIFDPSLTTDEFQSKADGGSTLDEIKNEVQRVGQNEMGPSEVAMVKQNVPDDQTVTIDYLRQKYGVKPVKHFPGQSEQNQMPIFASSKPKADGSDTRRKVKDQSYTQNQPEIHTEYQLATPRKNVLNVRGKDLLNPQQIELAAEHRWGIDQPDQGLHLFKEDRLYESLGDALSKKHQQKIDRGSAKLDQPEKVIYKSQSMDDSVKPVIGPHDSEDANVFNDTGKVDPTDHYNSQSKTLDDIENQKNESLKNKDRLEDQPEITHGQQKDLEKPNKTDVKPSAEDLIGVREHRLTSDYLNEQLQKDYERNKSKAEKNVPGHLDKTVARNKTRNNQKDAAENEDMESSNRASDDENSADITNTTVKQSNSSKDAPKEAKNSTDPNVYESQLNTVVPLFDPINHSTYDEDQSDERDSEDGDDQSEEKGYKEEDESRHVNDYSNNTPHKKHHLHNHSDNGQNHHHSKTKDLDTHGHIEEVEQTRHHSHRDESNNDMTEHQLLPTNHSEEENLSAELSDEDRQSDDDPSHNLFLGQSEDLDKPSKSHKLKDQRHSNEIISLDSTLGHFRESTNRFQDQDSQMDSKDNPQNETRNSSTDSHVDNALVLEDENTREEDDRNGSESREIFDQDDLSNEHDSGDQDSSENDQKQKNMSYSKRLGDLIRKRLDKVIPDAIKELGEQDVSLSVRAPVSLGDQIVDVYKAEKEENVDLKKLFKKVITMADADALILKASMERDDPRDEVYLYNGDAYGNEEKTTPNAEGIEKRATSHQLSSNEKKSAELIEMVGLDSISDFLSRYLSNNKSLNNQSHDFLYIADLNTDKLGGSGNKKHDSIVNETNSSLGNKGNISNKDFSGNDKSSESEPSDADQDGKVSDQFNDVDNTTIDKADDVTIDKSDDRSLERPDDLALARSDISDQTVEASYQTPSEPQGQETDGGNNVQGLIRSDQTTRGSPVYTVLNGHTSRSTKAVETPGEDLYGHSGHKARSGQVITKSEQSAYGSPDYYFHEDYNIDPTTKVHSKLHQTFFGRPGTIRYNAYGTHMLNKPDLNDFKPPRYILYSSKTQGESKADESIHGPNFKTHDHDKSFYAQILTKPHHRQDGHNAFNSQHDIGKRDQATFADKAFDPYIAYSTHLATKPQLHEPSAYGHQYGYQLYGYQAGGQPADTAYELPDYKSQASYKAYSPRSLTEPNQNIHEHAGYNDLPSYKSFDSYKPYNAPLFTQPSQFVQEPTGYTAPGGYTLHNTQVFKYLPRSISGPHGYQSQGGYEIYNNPIITKPDQFVHWPPVNKALDNNKTPNFKVFNKPEQSIYGPGDEKHHDHIKYSCIQAVGKSGHGISGHSGRKSLLGFMDNKFSFTKPDELNQGPYDSRNDRYKFLSTRAFSVLDQPPYGYRSHDPYEPNKNKVFSKANQNVYKPSKSQIPNALVFNYPNQVPYDPPAYKAFENEPFHYLDFSRPSEAAYGPGSKIHDTTEGFNEVAHPEVGYPRYTVSQVSSFTEPVQSVYQYPGYRADDFKPSSVSDIGLPAQTMYRPAPSLVDSAKGSYGSPSYKEDKHPESYKLYTTLADDVSFLRSYRKSGYGLDNDQIEGGYKTSDLPGYGHLQGTLLGRYGFKSFEKSTEFEPTNSSSGLGMIAWPSFNFYNDPYRASGFDGKMKQIFFTSSQRKNETEDNQDLPHSKKQSPPSKAETPERVTAKPKRGNESTTFGLLDEYAKSIQKVSEYPMRVVRENPDPSKNLKTTTGVVSDQDPSSEMKLESSKTSKNSGLLSVKGSSLSKTGKVARSRESFEETEHKGKEMKGSEELFDETELDKSEEVMESEESIEEDFWEADDADALVPNETFVCPRGWFISGIESRMGGEVWGHGKDHVRLFNFSCQPLPLLEEDPVMDCRWKVGEMGEMGTSLFNCGGWGVVSGWNATRPDPGARYVMTYQCCRPLIPPDEPRYQLTQCQLTPRYVNEQWEQFNFTVPEGAVLYGVNSDVTQPPRLDRRFLFEYCRPLWTGP